MNKNWKRTAVSLLAVIIGNFLYALTVKVFLLSSGLVTGGTTGIALVVNALTGLSVSAFVLIFNVAMLLVGWKLLGKKFAMTTVASTFLYPLALELWELLLGSFVLTTDLLLCAVFSGLGIGLSLGIVIRAGASTGGMDIPPLVLQRLFRIPISVSLYAFDIVILLAQLLVSPVVSVLYGVILVMVYTIVLDKMLLLGTTRTEIKVISEKADEIRDAILQQVDRGVTLLHAQTGHLRKETEVVLSIISNRELPKVERLIRDIDPDSFLVVNRVSEVRGRGFSANKIYQ